MSRAFLRPRALLTERLVVRRPSDTVDGQGGFTQAMRLFASCRGRLSMTPGERARIDPVSGRLLALTTATAWLDAYAFLGAAASLKAHDVLVAANDLGAAGDAITVAFVLPGVDGPLSVSISGTDITVTLARASGASTSTAAAVAAALGADADIGAVVTASTQAGAAVQAALARAPLAGGIDAALPRPRDEVVTPSGTAWEVVSVGEQNALVKCQLIGKVA